jgi:hypothetical protein
MHFMGLSLTASLLIFLNAQKRTTPGFGVQGLVSGVNHPVVHFTGLIDQLLHAVSQAAFELDMNQRQKQALFHKWHYLDINQRQKRALFHKWQYLHINQRQKRALLRKWHSLAPVSVDPAFSCAHGGRRRALT